MANLDRDFFVASFRRMAKTAEEHRDEWTKLDGDIGDGDHGINLTIGFREVVKQLDALPDDTDVAGTFKLVGMTLLRKVGGASGPLYGSFFMKAGAEVADQPEVSFDDLRRMLRAGVDAIIARGKAQVGDKTMIDSYLPGLEVLEAADPNDPVAAFSAFVDRNPTIKVLALAFLILIGMALIAESAHFNIPKGYLYFAMAFSSLFWARRLLS